jgi:hypothetical protein
MRKPLVALVGILVVIGWTPQLARAVEYRFDATLAAYRWVEDVAPTYPTEAGPMLLLGGYLSGVPAPAIPEMVLRGDVRLMLGWVNYETALISDPSTPVSTHTAYTGMTYEGSVGWRTVSGNVRAEPFLGVAYRWWLRQIASNGSVQGYPEWYYTIVGRLGLRLEQASAEAWRLYGVLSADPLLWATEVIDLTDSTGERLTVENGLKMGWTLELGLRGNKVDVGLFWQAVRLGESNIVACSFSSLGCLQPKSDQDIMGVKAAMMF